MARKWTWGAALVGALLIGGAALGAGRDLGYSGRLFNGEYEPLQGTFELTFRLYDAAEGGVMLWEDVIDNVEVENGYFDVLLSDGAAMVVTPLWALVAQADPLFVEVAVGEEVLAPRQQVGAVPWAFGVPDGAIGLDQLAPEAQGAFLRANVAETTAGKAHASMPLKPIIGGNPLPAEGALLYAENTSDAEATGPGILSIYAKLGLAGEATGDNDVKAGVYGAALGTGANYGIYGYAGGGTANYAGYFAGNVRIEGSLQVGKVFDGANNGFMVIGNLQEEFGAHPTCAAVCEAHGMECSRAYTVAGTYRTCASVNNSEALHCWCVHP